VERPAIRETHAKCTASRHDASGFGQDPASRRPAQTAASAAAFVATT
jgi:hypothetical protein